MSDVVTFPTPRLERVDWDVARRDDVTRLGLWMFLATVTMLFAAFTSALIVRRSGGDWRHLELPTILWANTLALALSSLALESARWAGGRRRWPLANLGLAASMALGLGFLGGQILAWRQLMEVGLFAGSSAHGSFFYMLTGAHGLHVVAALAVLAWGTAKTLSGAGRRDLHRWTSIMGTCRTFWHFLGAVWLYLFVLLSIY